MWRFYTPNIIQARVASTVAGLGGPVDGQLGLIRGGATPFTHIALIYDATYGKWVSDVVAESRDSVTQETNATTTYTNSGQVFIYIPGFKALFDAGLRPQVRMTAAMDNTTGGDGISVKAKISEYNDGDSAVTDITNASTPDPTMTMTGAAYVFKATDWVDFGAWGTAPAKAHGEVAMQFKAVTGGTAQLQQHSMILRWVG